MDKAQVHPGDHVYVICRNPHTASVATIAEAQIVKDEDQAGGKKLLLRDLYYEFAEDDAVFLTREEAERVYRQIYDED
ncbi:MAG: transcriptional regulator SplA domain-containing protein [Sporolactobacillus sp.]